MFCLCHVLCFEKCTKLSATHCQRWILSFFARWLYLFNLFVGPYFTHFHSLRLRVHFGQFIINFGQYFAYKVHPCWLVWSRGHKQKCVCCLQECAVCWLMAGALLYSYITNHDYHTRESSLIAFDDIIEWRAFGNVSCFLSVSVHPDMW